SQDHISDEALEHSSTNIVPENSVLIVNRSGILKHKLPVGIAQRPMAINQDIKALVCAPNIYPMYLAHFLKASEQTVLGWVRATTADNFPIENLKQLEIALPSLAEQKRIATILDVADVLRGKRRAAIVKLDNLAQSIFIEMFGDPAENPHNFE